MLLYVQAQTGSHWRTFGEWFGRTTQGRSLCSL